MEARTVSVVLVFVFAVASVPVAVAQDAPNGSPTPPNATNTTPAPRGPSVSFGPAIPEVPDPRVVAAKLIRGGVSSLADATARLIDEFNYLVFDLPAPGEPDDPDTWFTDDSGWWPAVRSMYFLFFWLAFAAIVAILMWAFRIDDTQERRHRWREIGKGAVLVLAGYPLTVLGLHIGGSLSMALAPSGAEFMTGAENILRFELGILLGAGLVLAKSVIVLVGIGILFVQYFLAHLLVAFWPVFVLLYVSGQDTLRSIGAVGISTFILLIALKFFQAAIMRFLFELPLAANSLGEGVVSAAAFVGIMLGVFVALIGLPYLFLKTVIPEAVLAIGGSTSRAAKQSDGVQSARDRVGDVRDRFSRSRGAVDRDESRQTYPRPAVRAERSAGTPTGVRSPVRASTPTPDGGTSSDGGQFRRRHHAQSRITYGYAWNDD